MRRKTTCAILIEFSFPPGYQHPVVLWSHCGILIVMHAVTETYRICRVIHAGRMEYQAAWDWQRRLVRERSSGRCGDTLLLLEHPPTITLGRASLREHVLLTPAELERVGVALVECDRGGDVTYHAPGQVVGYPIIKLSQYGGDLGRYLRSLEELIIQVLATYGIAGSRVAGLTGVWVDPEKPALGTTPQAKVAAIGVKLSASGVTSHGFALNVTTDLRGFAQIVPCGIRDRSVTSLEQVLGVAPPLSEVRERVVQSFRNIFGVNVAVASEEM